MAAKKKSNNSTDKTANNNDNITKHQWKPGQSGNPSGRPKNALSIKNAIGKLADSIPEDSDKPRADLLSELCWEKALKGEQWYIQFVTEHKEGKPHQSQSISLENTDAPYNQWLNKAKDAK